MRLLYFVPMLAVLGMSLSVHADSEGDTLQVWIDYVEEYRQYMEDYKQWASDRFEYYQNQITELTDQLDSKDARIQELESSIGAKDARIQELESSIGAKDARIQELEGSTNVNDNKAPEPKDTTQTESETEYYITTDKQTYTLGDTIHITGKEEAHVCKTTLDGGTFGCTPWQNLRITIGTELAYHAHRNAAAIICDDADGCYSSGVYNFISGSRGVGGYNIISYEYNNNGSGDGTFSIEIEANPAWTVGEEYNIIASNWHKFGSERMVFAQNTFTTTAPN